MKKVFITAICFTLLFTLTACTNTSKYEVDTKFTLKTCGKSCLYEEQSSTQLNEIWKYAKLEPFQYERPKDFTINFICADGTMYDRESLNTEFSIGGLFRKEYGQITSGFDQPNTYYRMLLEECEDKEECISKIFGDKKAENYEYGFNETSGYLNYDLVDSDGEIASILRSQFTFKNNELEYEYYESFNNDDSYHYQVLKDGEYKSYQIRNGNLYYAYINLNTMEYINFISYEDKDVFYYYNDVDGIGYEYNMYGKEFSIFVVEDTVDMVRLYKNETEYIAEVNFLNIEGWNKVEDYTYPLAPSGDSLEWSQVTLYNNDTRVFEDYRVYHNSPNPYYDGIYGMKKMTDTELSNYTLPSGFQGDVNISELIKDFKTFMEMESPLDILPFEKEDLLEMSDKLKNLYQ